MALAERDRGDGLRRRAHPRRGRLRLHPIRRRWWRRAGGPLVATRRWIGANPVALATLLSAAVATAAVLRTGDQIAQAEQARITDRYTRGVAQAGGPHARGAYRRDLPPGTADPAAPTSS
jgi:hypothetical protein